MAEEREEELPPREDREENHAIGFTPGMALPEMRYQLLASRPAP